MAIVIVVDPDAEAGATRAGSAEGAAVWVGQPTDPELAEFEAEVRRAEG